MSISIRCKRTFRCDVCSSLFQSQFPSLGSLRSISCLFFVILFSFYFLLCYPHLLLFYFFRQFSFSIISTSSPIFHYNFSFSLRSVSIISVFPISLHFTLFIQKCLFLLYHLTPVVDRTVSVDPIALSDDGIDAAVSSPASDIRERSQRADRRAQPLRPRENVDERRADCGSYITTARHTGQPYQKSGYVDAGIWISLLQ